jgi:hypothetical protein
MMRVSDLSARLSTTRHRIVVPEPVETGDSRGTRLSGFFLKIFTVEIDLK